MKSVLTTQRPVLTLQAEQGQLRARMEQVEKKLSVAIEAHRAQIAKSLTSKNPTERALAEGIATWWDVPPVV